MYADESTTELHTRRFTFGGKLLVVDIDFTTLNDVSSISKITLSIPADDESISSLGPAAASVLGTNFQMQDGENFVKNLTNLARWDGCSEPPTNEGLNCFAVLKGLEDALQLIYSQELESSTSEEQVLSKGSGKPERNIRNLIGLTITYLPGCYVLVGVEARRSQYVHPPLQNIYLSPEDPFITGMLNTNEIIPNWIEQDLNEGDINLIHGPRCSFVLDLEPSLIMSVDAAKKICEIIGYGGWNDVLNGVVKEEWISQDVMLDNLLVLSHSPIPSHPRASEADSF